MLLFSTTLKTVLLHIWLAIVSPIVTALTLLFNSRNSAPFHLILVLSCSSKFEKPAGQPLKIYLLYCPLNLYFTCLMPM